MQNGSLCISDWNNLIRRHHYALPVLKPEFDFIPRTRNVMGLSCAVFSICIVRERYGRTTPVRQDVNTSSFHSSVKAQDPVDELREPAITSRALDDRELSQRLAPHLFEACFQP